MSDVEAIIKLLIVISLGFVMPAIVLYNLAGWAAVGVLTYMVAFNYLSSDMVKDIDA